MDLFERVRKNMGPLGQYAKSAEGYYMFPKLEGPLRPRMRFRGKEVICWSINNYLGLGDHPEVRKVDAEAAAKWGLAYPMGARMMSGNTDEHEALERELAAFVGKESAVLLNYGYQGFMSAIDALLSRRDVVVYDAESHACIIDGLRMHLGKRFAYDHNDMASLEKNLQRATRLAGEQGGGILVITEGVFGMNGNQGNLKEIVELKKQYSFRLMVDDAHGFGTLGRTGAGTGEEQGVQDGIDIYMSTFAKSMASIGAFVAGEKDILTYLKYNLRSQIFAKALPMPLVVGARTRLRLIQEHPEYLHQLWANVKALQTGLKERGLNIGNTKSCVTPVYLKGQPEEATALVHDLRENFGIFCSIVTYPVVPKGVLILRLIPTALHTKEDIDTTLDAFAKIADRLNRGEYRQEEIYNPLLHSTVNG